MPEKLSWVAVPILGKLTGVDWAVIHFKVSLLATWLLFVVFAPGEVMQWVSHQPIFWVWGAASVGGTTVSLAGLVVSAQNFGLRRRLGFRIEMFGLFMCLSGPLSYSAFLIGANFYEFSIGRLTYALMGYALSAALIVRMALVRESAKRTVKQVSF